MDILAKILGYLLNLCYRVTGIYPLAVAVFTFLTKLILLPISIWVQKNSIKMVRITPEIYDIKIKYYGDPDTVNEKTAELYKREKYHPFLSVVPLILQLVILLGVIGVVREPSYSGMTNSDLTAFGIDHSLISGEIGGLYLLFPVFAALSSVFMSLAQNKSQVLQAEQSNLNKYGTLVFSAALSLWLGFFVNAGVALYWILSNIFSVIQMYILNALIDPRKYIDYELLKKNREELQGMNKADSSLTKEQKKRQNKDYKRFFSVLNKHIVFYSEQSGFYKYYRRLINWLLDNSNITIHYVTSDPDDQIFAIAEKNSRIRAYFIGERKLITLFMKMDARIVVMTTPDLENFHLKRSYTHKDIEYIYLHHGISSVNMTIRKHALDHYDTIFGVGPHVFDEIRAEERAYSLPEKKFVEHGYGLLDDLSEEHERYMRSKAEKSIKSALIAPSYQNGNILDSCLDEIVASFLKNGCRVTIRPHPQYVKRMLQKWEEIEKKYADNDMVTAERSFSSDESIYSADTVVTDWSNIGCEFAFSSLRPVLFVDTPMKVINPDYTEIGVEPLDIYLRDKIGIRVSGKDPDELDAAVKKLIGESSEFAVKISEERDKNIYNFGCSDKAGGKYILSRLKKQSEKKGRNE